MSSAPVVACVRRPLKIHPRIQLLRMPRVGRKASILPFSAYVEGNPLLGSPNPNKNISVETNRKT